MTLSVVFVEGFDEYTTGYQTAPAGFDFASKWDAANGAPTIGTAYGRFGSAGAQWTAATDWRKRIAPTGVVGVALGFCVTLTSGGMVLCAFLGDDGVTQCYVRVNPNGSVAVATGTPSRGSTAGPIVATTAAGVIPSGGYCHLEVQVGIGAGAGTVHAWVNQVPVLAATGRNTQGLSTSPDCVQVRFGCQELDATPSTDDLVIYDASARTTGERLGNVRVYTRMPASDAAVTGTWTQTGGTAGQRYTTVDEIPADGDTSYLANGTPGDRVSFGMAPLGVTPPSVLAVAVSATVRQDDAAARSVAVGLRSGATDDMGAAVTTNANYRTLQHVANVDPATGLPWSVTTVDAMTPVVEVAA